jgi:hypothetical protein
MKPALSLILIAALIGPDALAAGPKPKICFNAAEQNAEQLVRGGLRLREGAAGCDGPPWDFHTKPLWDQVDQQFGARFKQQTDIRRRAFEREFSKDAENNERMWDGRTVLYFRNYPLSVPYCTEIRDSLQNILKKGWGAFVKHAQRAKDEVEADYRPCS